MSWYQNRLARCRRKTRERQQRAAAAHAENAARLQAERLAMANSWTGPISCGERQQVHPNPEQVFAEAFAEIGRDYNGQRQQSQARA